MTVDVKSVGAAPDFAVKLDWPVVRLWQVAKIRSEKNRPELPLLSVFLGRGVISYGEGGGQVHKPGQDLSIYQVVRTGDFVLNNQQAWRGSVGVSKHDGIISPAYVVLALSEVMNPRFADYLFQSRVMVAQFVTSSKGVGDIQRDIHLPWLKNARVPVPTLEEQATMARFLDYANARLEHAIRAKRKAIALLNEQKQAIIHRAVTRGLDPTVPLKPSGIPWLGDIPNGWDVQRLKRVARIIDGDRGHEYPNAADFVAVGIPFLSSKSITNGKLDFKGVPFISEGKFQRLRQGKLVAGDLVITVRGTIGNCALFSGKLHPTAFINAQMMILRPETEKVLNNYLWAITQSKYWIDRLAISAYGSAQQQLSNQILAGISLPIPPIEEQRAILSGLAERTVFLDNAITRLEREIELLRQYRTRLVADVVTGKLDVRPAARHLPAEPVAPEPAPDPEELTEPEESEV